MTLSNAIGFSLLLVGLALTVLLYFGHPGPIAETRDFKIWEVPTPPAKGEKI